MTTHTIAVGGGKGGVGKSLIAANLAIALAQAGKRVVLIDADLGGANLHTMFGIDRPAVLLEHFLVRRVSTLADVVLETEQPGLGLICGGMPTLGAANPTYTEKQKLIRHIQALPYELALLDIGAGTGYNVLDLFNAADHKLVVFTPQLTSLHNGYGFLKAAVHRKLQRALSPEVRKALESTGAESGSETLVQVLARIGAEWPEEEAKARLILDGERLFLIGNLIRSPKEEHVVAAIAQVVRDHLQLEAPLLGVIAEGEKLHRSVNHRRPFMLYAGLESNAEAFRAIVHKLLAHLEYGGRLSAFPMPPVPPQRPSIPARLDRDDPRFPLRGYEAELRCGALAARATIINMAHGGVQLAVDEPLPEPADGTFVLLSTRGGENVELEVEERHRDDGGRRVGFSFRGMDEVKRSAIERIIAAAAAATAVRKLTTPPHGNPYSKR